MLRAQRILLRGRGTSTDESKHYVTNQYHPEHYGLYPLAGKYSGWQETIVYLYWTWKQQGFRQWAYAVYYVPKSDAYAENTHQRRGSAVAQW